MIPQRRAPICFLALGLSLAGLGCSSTSTPAPQAPAKPVLETPAMVTAGFEGWARVVYPLRGPDLAHFWTINGGTFYSGSNTAKGMNVSFTAATEGSILLTCTAQFPSGGPFSPTSSATITVLPIPIITTFVASSTEISSGMSTNITSVFSNGSGYIDNGVGPVTSGQTITISPTTTAFYRLRVTNQIGDHVDSKILINVLPIKIAVDDEKPNKN